MIDVSDNPIPSYNELVNVSLYNDTGSYYK